MPQEAVLNLSVLIVEDDVSTRLGLVLALEPLVGRVYQAGDGSAGLELFHRHHPDVVLTDLRMPILDGLGLVRAIRESGREPFIIVMSSHGEEQSYLEAIELGVNQFIKKPFTPDDVLKGLERAASAIAKRKADSQRRALSVALLNHTPNCLLLTDGRGVLHFIDPRSILPESPCDGQAVEDFLNEQFVLMPRRGGNAASLPADIPAWLGRGRGREFILGCQKGKAPPGKRFLLRLDRVDLNARTAFLLTFTDITRVEKERARFHMHAGRDFLTGVGNRLTFETELAKEMSRARRYGTELCLMMLDVDDFKKVNDTLGHQTGDLVLTELARTLAKSVRSSDVVCRFGGEEFMVIMPQTALDGAVACARKLAGDVADKDFGIDRRVTVSVGVAQYEPGESALNLVGRVDNAMYDAKAGGKNQVIVASRDQIFSAED